LLIAKRSWEFGSLALPFVRTAFSLQCDHETGRGPYARFRTELSKFATRPTRATSCIPFRVPGRGSETRSHTRRIPRRFRDQTGLFYPTISSVFGSSVAGIPLRCSRLHRGVPEYWQRRPCSRPKCASGWETLSAIGDRPEIGRARKRRLILTLPGGNPPASVASISGPTESRPTSSCWVAGPDSCWDCSRCPG
jgi:hypothetical protein